MYFIAYMYKLSFKEEAIDDGRYYLLNFFYCYFSILKLDVEMASPPFTPPRRTHQGVLKAQGGCFNS